MAVSYGKGEKAKALKLHSLLVRSRGVCQRCGEADYSKLQCAHIRRRTYSATATDEANAWALCFKCHFAVDTDASEFMALVERTIGLPEFERLKQKSLDGVGKKVDWSLERARLAELWKQVAA